MRSSDAHFPLDTSPPIRYRVNSALGALALIDSKRQTRTVLFSVTTGNRHGFKWCGLDAHALADWLNDRDAGYPRHPNIGLSCYDR